MVSFLRRMLIPAVFAVIFIIIPATVIGFATKDDPLVIKDVQGP